ncbi:hypothetical protein FIBSPDRAFT_962220 [Athelia psychrophila]|uniref:Uncharacterized protein n=1 Tax=Athelia psychrophila TaxID=1759441 RepID=A0A166AG24_9AGAM|nr:hypothetical protein FIBSPDRAFT_962220 [Fibularhizoctonia sp. CBS 109695]
MLVAEDRVNTSLAFAIERGVLQECIGLAIVPWPNQPHRHPSGLHHRGLEQECREEVDAPEAALSDPMPCSQVSDGEGTLLSIIHRWSFGDIRIYPTRLRLRLSSTLRKTIP